MQVFKDFLVWDWPDHGFGKEMQGKALFGPGQSQTRKSLKTCMFFHFIHFFHSFHLIKIKTIENG